MVCLRKGKPKCKTTKQLLFTWIYYPPVPCSKIVGGVLTMRLTSNSDNLQFPIVLLALGVGLRMGVTVPYDLERF